VDFTARAKTLQSAETLRAALQHWRDGDVKQAVIAKLLAQRAETPDLFARGSYEPLRTRGPRAKNVLAFARRHAGKVLLVAVPRLCAAPCMETAMPLPPAAFWHGTGIEMRGVGTWHDVLTDAEHDTLDCEALFAAFPAAVLHVG